MAEKALDDKRESRKSSISSLVDSVLNQSCDKIANVTYVEHINNVTIYQGSPKPGVKENLNVEGKQVGAAVNDADTDAAPTIQEFPVPPVDLPEPPLPGKIDESTMTEKQAIDLICNATNPADKAVSPTSQDLILEDVVVPTMRVKLDACTSTHDKSSDEIMRRQESYKRLKISSVNSIDIPPTFEDSDHTARTVLCSREKKEKGAHGRDPQSMYSSASSVQSWLSGERFSANRLSQPSPTSTITSSTGGISNLKQATGFNQADTMPNLGVDWTCFANFTTQTTNQSNRLSGGNWLFGSLPNNHQPMSYGANFVRSNITNFNKTGQLNKNGSKNNNNEFYCKICKKYHSLDYHRQS